MRWIERQSSSQAKHSGRERHLLNVATELIQLSTDDLLTIDCAGSFNVAEIQRLAAALRNEGWLEVVAGFTELCVQFDSTVELPQQAKARLETWLEQHQANAISARCSDHRTIEVPICYDHQYAHDLPWLSERLGIDEPEVIRLHSSKQLTVQLIGYLPGFAYCGENDPRLDVERLPSPRERVAAGSVGINFSHTGIYTLPGPGGWPIIGCTPMRLFWPKNEQPAVLLPGHRIRFQPITSDEFIQLSETTT